MKTSKEFATPTEEKIYKLAELVRQRKAMKVNLTAIGEYDDRAKNNVLMRGIEGAGACFGVLVHRDNGTSVFHHESGTWDIELPQLGYNYDRASFAL